MFANHNLIKDLCLEYTSKRQKKKKRGAATQLKNVQDIGIDISPNG